MTTRRRFLTTSTAAFAAPFILTSRRAAAAEAAGRTIRLGHIGVGGQGSGLLRNFLSVPGAQSVAIADPFRQRREAGGQAVKEIQGHDPKLYNDFREMLADPEIDAVVIATPDHWHVPIGLAAVRAGNPVPHLQLERRGQDEVAAVESYTIGGDQAELRATVGVGHEDGVV